MPESAKRAQLSLHEEMRAVEDWQRRGLRIRCARALAQEGIVTIEDLKAASDHELSTIPNITRKNLVEIYRFIGRTMPGNVQPNGRGSQAAASAIQLCANYVSLGMECRQNYLIQSRSP